jgi:transcriptional/translational regulatory protein YebC/TACO1
VFEKRGVVLVDAERYSEDDLMAAIDAGADDVTQDGSVLEVLTQPGDLQGVREALEAAGVDIERAELTMRPTSRVEVDDDRVATLLRLLEALEDNDDVAAVHANFDADEAALERAAA